LKEDIKVEKMAKRWERKLRDFDVLTVYKNHLLREIGTYGPGR